MNELALFAGAGGGILGGMLCGWRTVCAVEIEDYPRRVLLQRQADGILPRFPIWDDVRTFDGKPWCGKIDIISGGFPCQDISAAGKGKGITGERSGLWKEYKRIICEVRPRFAYIENSPMLIVRGLDVVLCDLAEMGYDAEWGVIGAHHVGAPHKRDRIWILAYTSKFGSKARITNPENGEKRNSTIPYDGCSNMANSNKINDDHGRHATGTVFWIESEPTNISRGQKIRNTTIQGFNWSNKPMGESGQDAKFKRSDWWSTEPELGRVAHGVPHRVDRLKSIGNGQVPSVARLAWNNLNRR